MEISRRLGYLTEEDVSRLRALTMCVGKQLTRLWQALEAPQAAV